MTTRDLDKVLFDPNKIARIVDSIAADIRKKRYDLSSGKATGSRLVLLAPLKGSYMFLSDLSRALNRLHVPHIVEFISVRSYSNTSSTGNIEILCDVREDLKGDHVIIVEDIVDTGLTLQKLIGVISNKEPMTLELCM